MKLIIDIDEDLFNELLQGTASNRQNDKILKCVKNAISLQTELEEIKDEIMWEANGQICARISSGKVLQILDNHIKEN